MVEFEADDAIAAAADRFAADPAVERIVICTPDKDLAQCVRGDHVVLWDRRRDIVYDEEGVRAKGGVPPASVADRLALVGDAADGFPGLPGWGEKSAAAVLARYGHLEAIPAEAGANDLRYDDTHYDHGCVDRDMNCVFPIDRARELAAEGRIGGLTARHFSLGYSQALRDLRERTIPALVHEVDRERPGAVLLTGG
jgi:5'-3' exonuclease